MASPMIIYVEQKLVEPFFDRVKHILTVLVHSTVQKIVFDTAGTYNI